MVFAPLALAMGIETPATKAFKMGQSNVRDLTLVTPSTPPAAQTGQIVLPAALTPTLVAPPALAVTPALVVAPSLEQTPVGERTKPALALTPYAGRAAPGYLASQSHTGSSVANVGSITPAPLHRLTEAIIEVCVTPGVQRPLYQGIRGSYNMQSAWIAASIVNEILRNPSMALDWPYTQKVLRVMNKIYSSEIFTKIADLAERPRGYIDMYCMVEDPVYDKPRVVKLNYGPETSRAMTHLDFLVRAVVEACQHVRRWQVLAVGRNDPNEPVLAGFRDIADFLQARVHQIPEEDSTPQYYRDKLAVYPVAAANAIGHNAEEVIKSSVRMPITVDNEIEDFDLSAIEPGNEHLGPDMTCQELEDELNGLGAC